MRTTFTRDIASVADRHGLSGDLVEALVVVESGGNPWAINPEPRYRYLWNVKTHQPFRPLTLEELSRRTPPEDFPTLAGDRDQEWLGQATSWGLMQIMGAVAREQGFMGPYLTELCRPEINLAIGCSHLVGLMRWAHRDEARALAAYNAGKGGVTSEAGIRYSQKVLAARAAL